MTRPPCRCGHTADAHLSSRALAPWPCLLMCCECRGYLPDDGDSPTLNGKATMTGHEQAPGGAA